MSKGMSSWGIRSRYPVPRWPKTAMDLTERVARAICRAWFYCDLDKPDGIEHWKKNQAKCMAEARAAMREMASALEK